MTTPLRPFLKWAGGKRHVLPILLQRAPATFRRYYEPFIGGGAMLFALQPAEAVIYSAPQKLDHCRC